MWHKKATFCQYSFNPFVSELYIYKKIALSDVKAKLMALPILGFDTAQIRNHTYNLKKDLNILLNTNPWDIRIVARSAIQAYQHGKGWMTVRDKDMNTSELATRLVLPSKGIIGSVHVNAATFNRFLNPCRECRGDGKLNFLNEDAIINDKGCSILNDGFFVNTISNKLKAVMRLEIKPAIKRLKDEGLFDFSIPYSSMRQEELNMFLHGFIHRKFLKPNGVATTLSDYIAWKGLFFTFVTTSVTLTNQHPRK